MNKPSLFSELKRRNVYKVAAAYAVVGWLVIQISSTVLPTFHAPEWVVQTLVVLVALGFPIALILAWAFEATPQGIQRTEVADTMPAAREQKKHTWIYVVVIGGAVSAVLFFLGRYTAGNKTTAAGANESLAKSIAVLPFDNLSRDPDNAFFAEGVQDEILTRLAKVADLKVISRTSTQHFKSAPDNLPQIAKQLGVMNILEGSVQKANDQVRVNVQLINAMTDAHLWAEIYDRKLSDIFAVQSEIAKTVADQLQAKLTGSEKKMMAAQPTNSMEAYELYHKGRSLWEKRTGDNIPKAIAFYEQAIARDPNYALAYAGLASAHILSPFYAGTDRRESHAKAKEAALKALQLDPNLAEAHSALGKIFFFGDIDIPGAMREYKRATELNPNDAGAHHWYGNDALAALSRFDEAIFEGKRAVELDPLSVVINADLASTLYYARRYDEAIAHLKKTLELDPTSFYTQYTLAIALQGKGDLRGAIAEYEKAKESSGDNLAIAVYCAAAKGLAGDREAAQRMLGELDEISKHREVVGYFRALLYLSLNNKDEALRWLEQGYAERDGSNISTINVDPLLLSLHGDPRFDALVQKVVGEKKVSAGEQRKLAAIMFTDMVGYSALSQRDEKLAQELLEEHRRLLREIFPRFNGTEIKTIGDAFLVEFNSALEAAQCAIEIQRTLAKRNADIAPDRRIELKIGIHIGDVVHRDGDVYGDGVNIASRIEPLAGAGGVCVSMDVERQIRNALEARFEKLAPTDLKNISVAMDLFRIVLPWEREAKPRKGATEASARIRPFPASSWAWIGLLVLAVGAVGWWVAHRSSTQPAPGASTPPAAKATAPATAGQKSIAVLPLVNTSGDPNNEYFSDGLSEELIAVLAKIPDLTVIGRSSSFLFKGQSSDSASIGQKLGVAHLIEGSVRRQGDRVRIVAELIHASTGRSLWSETYDRELKDVFAVQSEIASAVAEQMKVKLLGQTAQSDAMPSSQNLEAHNAVLQADFYFQQQTAESIQRAITFLQEAVKLDPNYGFAYARLSQAWRQYGASFATGDAEHAYAQAREAAETASRLAPDLVESHKAQGWIAMNPALDFRTAEKEFRLALAGAPGDAAAKNALSYTLMAQGRLAEAEQVCHEAIALDPLLTSLWYNLGRLAVGGGRYQEAQEKFRKGLELQPRAARFHTYLAALAVLQNNLDEARQHAQLETDAFWHNYATTLVQQAQPDHAAADAALKSFSSKYAVNGAYQIAVLHAMRKEPEEMFRWLDTAYATHDSGLTQLVITPFVVDYRNDPRFIAFCQKLGVQLPAKP